MGQVDSPVRHPKVPSPARAMRAARITGAVPVDALPLVAYGGSSLVSGCLSMGILLGISSMNAEDEARDIERIALIEEAEL